jgi:hypothetical protein
MKRSFVHTAGMQGSDFSWVVEQVRAAAPYAANADDFHAQ